MDRRPDLLAGRHATDVALVAKVEDEDRQLVLHAERHGGRVHHAVALTQEIGVSERLDPVRRRVQNRVGGVDAVHLRALQERGGVDLERALGRARVGGEVRDADPCREDHDPPLLEMPDRAQRQERLGHLGHRDRRLHARRHVDLLEGILERERVHDRREHPHVVGAVALDAGSLPATPDVAPADPHRRLDADVDHLGELARDEARGRIGDPGSGGRGEGFAGELQQDTVVHGSCAAVIHTCRDPPSQPRRPRGRPSLLRRQAASSPSLNRANRLTCTFSPVLALTSSRYCWIVLVSSFTNGWSRSTLSFRNASTLPSTILGTTLSDLPDSRACASAIFCSDSRIEAGTSSRVTHRGADGLAMCRARSFTSWRNSSVFATKSVSQLTSTSAPTVLLKWTYASTRPWLALRPARLAALARPFSRRSSVARTTSPSASISARLQSIIPAPVASRSSLTIAAVTSAITTPPRRLQTPPAPRRSALLAFRRARPRRSAGRRASLRRRSRHPRARPTARRARTPWLRRSPRPPRRTACRRRRPARPGAWRRSRAARVRSPSR